MMGKQVELMRRFIVEEANACESADPEMVTVFGCDWLDFLHPKTDTIGGVHISSLGDENKVTVLVCKPMLEYEPTIIRFWEGDNVLEHSAVYFCPNALLVVRPTEEGDETLMQTTNEEETSVRQNEQLEAS